MHRVLFILLLLFLFGIPLQFGGYPWLAICLVALVIQCFGLLWNVSRLVTLLPCLLWIGVFQLTDNREMFFPYVIYFTSQTALICSAQNVWLGTFSGVGVVATFLGIRFFQAAPIPVLILEFGIALAILETAILAFRSTRRSAISKVLISGMASLLALASLLI
ncbi:MAG: hypothetical protein KDA84_04065 [Planctomycetaceae bacterium]|nr:hypothetical protein [Planctomycetaceae bacterium]